MKNHSSYLACLAALTLFTLLTARAFAQNTHAPAIETTHLRFLFLDETAGDYSLKTGTSFRQISSTPYAVSRPIQAKPGESLEIFKDSQNPDPITGKPTRLKIATVQAPENTTASLVVITPRPTLPGSTVPLVYNVAFFDNDPRAFPPQSIRILNLGLTPLAARFGPTEVVVPAGTSKIVKPSTDSRSRVFSKIAAQTSSGWKLLYDSILMVRPNECVTGIFVYSPNGLLHTYTRQELLENGPPPPGHFWLTYSETL